MILEKQTDAIIQQEGQSQESIGMSLDLDSAQILMQMLSKNLYSDAIGSTVRECASNALDSHRRAGVSDPIIVSFKTNTANNYEFSVEDFGIGLDAEDVKNIISKYGKSTKRNSATELGMMGLGFKAPLAYSSSFYFVCRKDGMERKYMMYEGEDTNTIDLLYEKPTTERNGVKVIVPVQYHDRREFYEKIREQLAYFQSVYFDVPGEIDNDFQIIRHEHFQWSPLSNDKYLHICLDDVYYSLDSQKVGISNINFPVALRFSLTDGIFPTPNRESIRYTKEAKEIIFKKLGQVANYMIEKYNESILETDNIIEIMNYYSDDSRNLEFGKSTFDVSPFLKYATVKLNKPKLKGVEKLNLELLHRNKEYILSEYEVKYKIENGRFKECKRAWDKTVKINDMTKDRHFLMGDKLSGRKKDYLRETMGKDTGWRNQKYFLKKTSSFTLGRRGVPNYATYMSILQLGSYPKSEWRSVILEFQSVVRMYIDHLQRVDDIQVPQDWIDSKKKVKVSVSSVVGKTKRVKLKGEMVGKKAMSLERYVDGKHCKWVPTTFKMDSIHKESCLTVYGTQSQADMKLMDNLFHVSFGLKKTKIDFVSLSERELNNISKLDIHNWIKLEHFMEGKNKPFKRIVTAYLIKTLMSQNEDVFEKKSVFTNISDDLHRKLEILEAYKNDHHVSTNDDVYEAMLSIAEEHNLFDGEIYPIYKQVNGFLTRFTFVQTLCDVMPYRNYDKHQLIKVLVDMLKYHKQRVDWKNYNIKLNDDLVVKELTEEKVENLLED